MKTLHISACNKFRNKSINNVICLSYQFWIFKILLTYQINLPYFIFLRMQNIFKLFETSSNQSENVIYEKKLRYYQLI